MPAAREDASELNRSWVVKDPAIAAVQRSHPTSENTAVSSEWELLAVLCGTTGVEKEGLVRGSVRCYPVAIDVVNQEQTP